MELPIPSLPVELNALIFTMDWNTWTATIRKLGTLTLDDRVQAYAKQQFLHCVQDSYGIRNYLLMPQYSALHSTNDCPAFMNCDIMMWRRFGRLHRSDGPAIITNKGNMYWCMHHKRCRKFAELPHSIEHTGLRIWKHTDGSETYRDAKSWTTEHVKNGKPYRSGLPAVIIARYQILCWHDEDGTSDHPDELRPNIMIWNKRIGEKNITKPCYIKNDGTQYWYKDENSRVMLKPCGKTKIVYSINLDT